VGGDRDAGRKFFVATPNRSHTEPRLIQKWLLGPDGWTMPVCVNEPQPGGKARYEWADGKGVPPDRRPDGWTMPVCVNEPQPGGKARYEWSDGKGGGFHLTGEYLELIPFSRIVMWNGCTCPNRRWNRPVLAAVDETGIIVAGKDAEDAGVSGAAR
jgi:hypothetical protein